MDVCRNNANVAENEEYMAVQMIIFDKLVI